MTSFALADLQKVLTPHVHLGKSRMETLCLLVIGRISARTVNLTHIAAERPAHANVVSTYRRRQRFFQQVILPDDWSVGIVMALIGNPDRWYLCVSIEPTGRSANPMSTSPCWPWLPSATAFPSCGPSLITRATAPHSSALP